MCTSTARVVTLESSPCAASRIWLRVNTQPRTPCQQMQNTELRQRELHESAGHLHLVATRMNLQAVMRNDGVARLRLALLTAQYRLDTGLEHARAEWFGEVVVGAQFEAGDHVGLFAFGREDDYRNAGRAGVVFKPPANLQAVDARQHQVQHDEIGWRHAYRGKRFFTGGHAGHVIVVPGQAVADEFENIRLIVHHENPYTCHATPSAPIAIAPTAGPQRPSAHRPRRCRRRSSARAACGRFPVTGEHRR